MPFCLYVLALLCYCISWFVCVEMITPKPFIILSFMLSFIFSFISSLMLSLLCSIYVCSVSFRGCFRVLGDFLRIVRLYNARLF